MYIDSDGNCNAFELIQTKCYTYLSTQSNWIRECEWKQKNLADSTKNSYGNEVYLITD